MKNLLGLVAAALLVCGLSASQVRAAGFRLPDQDAAAMGMGGAFAGQADDPSAAWYNPAGITQLDGTRVSAGVIGIYPVLKHENQDGTTDVAQREVFLPGQFFATNRMNDHVTFGFGLTSPFGLSTYWSPLSETRYVATFSRVKTINLNPNIAYKLNDSLSVAAGLDVMYLQATMENVLPFPGNPVFRLDGSGFGYGANVGVKYDPSQNVNIGFSYRSRIKVKVDGTIDLTGPAPTSGSGSTDITLPDLIQAGVSYKATDALTFNGDLEYTWWSTYDRLVIDSDVAAFNATDEKDWKNTWTFRFGGQYRLSDQWKVRAGYVYDQTPVPEARFDTRTPDADRQGVTLGAGYTSGNLTIDTAFMCLRFKNRTIGNSLADDATPAPNALNGTYKSVARLLALTVGYKF